MTLTYLDNNATTRVDDRVLETMLPLLTEQYGNPSSTHHFGAQLGGLVEESRAQVASLIGAREREITFTSGATEANNAALRGVLAARPEKRHLIISSVEHAAVLEPAAELERLGYQVTRLPVDRNGLADLDALRTAISEQTALVSCILVNNETGVITPIPEIAKIAHEFGVPVHTDAVQAVGKLPVDVGDLGVDLLSFTAHKIHGPKGIGALYVRRAARIRPFIIGGPQERGRRGGTLNAPAIAGFATACELAEQELDTRRQHVGALRDRLESGIIERFPNAVVIGKNAPRNAFTSCVCFPGVEAEAALVLLSQHEICLSSGAACSSGSLEPSHVLKAMQVDPYVAQGQIRFSLSRYTTAADIDHTLAILPGVIEKLAAVNI